MTKREALVAPRKRKKRAKKQIRSNYRIGLNPDCPLHGAAVGGFYFPRSSFKVTGTGPKTKFTEMDGAVVQLNDAELSRIKEQVQRKVIIVMKTKRGTRTQVGNYDSKYYDEAPNDVPLADYLYVEKLDKSPFEEISRPTLQDELDKSPPGEIKKLEE